jgi:hypothetical protein
MVYSNTELSKANDKKLMIATYSTIYSMKKGIVDTSKPKTFNMAKRLSDMKKVNNFHLIEHYNNWNSMQRRINEIGSVYSSTAIPKKEKS